MLYILFAFIFVIAATPLKGYENFSLGDLTILLSIPALFTYKLFNNRPFFLSYAGMVSGVLGSISFLHALCVIPILYYFHAWGWMGGVIGGIVSVLLFPIAWIGFLIIAFVRGDALAYLGTFGAAICFGFAGLLLLNSVFSKPIWKYFSRKN